MTDIALELLASTLKLALWAFIFYAALSAWKWSRKQKPGWREHIEFELGWEGLLPRVHYSCDSEEQMEARPQTAASVEVRQREPAVESRAVMPSVSFKQSEMYTPQHAELAKLLPADPDVTELRISLPQRTSSPLIDADDLEEAARWRYNRERTAS